MVIDPVNFQAQVEGGVVWGLGHAIQCELTYADGVPQQTNFHAYQSLRPKQTPRIEVRALQTTAEVRGIGEPPVPPGLHPHWPTPSSPPPASASANFRCTSMLGLPDPRGAPA
jgi:Molybdopterin-binding domain of aldehyde dehydrogenase